MDQFKLANLFNSISYNRARKFHSLLTSCKHIIGENYATSEEYVYVKNCYKYFNKQCDLKDVEIYKIKNDKFYRVFYCESPERYCVEFYPLSEVKSICLKEHKHYSVNYADLSISFKCGQTIDLSSTDDTYDEIASDALTSMILDIYNVLNSKKD